jgi:hypothetical protein
MLSIRSIAERGQKIIPALEKSALRKKSYRMAFE